MLKPNVNRLAANTVLASSVSDFLAAGGSVTKIEKPGVGAGLKRRSYLKGKKIYGVYQMNKND